MTKFHIVLFSLTAALFMTGICYAEGESTVYGQTPPGLTPEVFAPGIVSTGSEFSCAMSSDGTEFYFARFGTNPRRSLMLAQLSESGVSDPVPFTPLQGNDAYEPGLSRDGNTLYFMTTTLIPPNTNGSIDLWRVERTGGNWSTPIHMGFPFANEGTLSVSISDYELIYTTDNRSGQMNANIATTRKKPDGQYEELKILPEAVNTSGMDAYPAIAPDEDYLVYTSMGADKKPGLFVSFKDANCIWSQAQPIDLGGLVAVAPCLSHDGKYLFFTANRNIYWISSEIFLQLRPDGQ